ncbi:MAG: penicillin acylase family protein [Spirochaetota bacterium]
MKTKDVRETRDDMIVKSMRDAVAQVSEKFGKNEKKWAWGRVHKMLIKHPLGTVLPFLNLGPYSYAGDDFTIHAGWWDRYNPFEMKSGAAIRLVVDMADLSTMTVMSPPGQSGHYLSPHYGDLAETWAKGGTGERALHVGGEAFECIVARAGEALGAGRGSVNSSADIADRDVAFASEAEREFGSKKTGGLPEEGPPVRAFTAVFVFRLSDWGRTCSRRAGCRLPGRPAGR